MNFFDKCSSTEIRAAAAKTTGPWKSFFKDNRTRPLLGHVNQIRIDSVAHVVQANTVMPYGSPFLDSSTHSSAGSLAILYLRRDLLIPVLLGRSSAGSEQEDSAREDGKEEEEVDRVVHTRFGSYPHSQLIGVAWGSQIAAKKVETDGRGRKRRKRRKLGDGAERNEAATDTRVKTGENVADDGGHVERDRGFIYILKPTPELWAQCLPHRTQIIYTPDYSYIIFRLHMRPGEVVLEAGAGSGSFTHAAARAIFNGFPPLNQGDRFDDRRHCHRYGRIYSFECFEPRAAALRKEIKQHGLDRVVSILDRDVCKDGFRVADGETGELQFQADAIFLDMPTPWLAIPHLRREGYNSPAGDIELGASVVRNYKSPLNPAAAIRLCTFLPCIEQVQQTIPVLRQYGWVEVETVELMHRRIDVRRERIGLQEEGLRGVRATPATVEEAVNRLREVNKRLQAYHEASKEKLDAQRTGDARVIEAAKAAWAQKMSAIGPSRQERLDENRRAVASRDIFKEGRLTTRTEPDLKTHTGFLTFAILPISWTEEDEERCRNETNR